MKLWSFGAIINALVLSVLFVIFIVVGGVGVDEFIGYFSNLGKAEETIRLILTTIKIDLATQWYYTLAGTSLFLFLSITLVVFPFVELCMEERSLTRPRMFLYTTITFLSLPLGGGILMLLSLSGLKNNIFRSRREWLEETHSLIDEPRTNRVLNSYGYSQEQVESMTNQTPYVENKDYSDDDDFFTKEDFEQNERDMKRLMEDEEPVYYDVVDNSSDLELVEENEIGGEYRYTEEYSDQPSYNRNFERRSVTNVEIENAEVDRSNLKSMLIKIEYELERIKNSRVDRAKEISLRRKLREIEYDLEDNAKYLERLKNRQLR